MGEKLAESKYLENGREKEARMTEIAMGDCINLERVGEEWRKTVIDRKNLRLLIVRKKWEEEKTMETEIMVNHPNFLGLGGQRLRHWALT